MRSVVAGTSERLRRRVYEVTGLQEVFNDSNVNVLLKSSPDKTVAALSPISELSGTVVKLNDSGSWRTRHGLLVPHTFLYYFCGADRGSCTPELRPHGVIDLELYTDVRVVDDTVVRLAPADDTLPIRTFYFRLSDKSEAETWARAIRDTRFSNVREERDALLGVKAVLTEQVEILAEDLRESHAAIEASQRREAAALSELARYDANNARRVEQVQALLAAAAGSPPRGRYDISDNGCEPVTVVEAPRPRVRAGGAAVALSELAALGEAIADRAREVADLKAENADIRAEAAAAAVVRRRDEAAALDLLNEERKRTAEEATARLALEDEVQSLRRELEENRAAKEEARVNLGVVAASCREAEAKARELQEHRRVLAREVKASRAEKLRLSAALACATTAAAAAAATVEISRSISSASSSSVNGLHRDRSSSDEQLATASGRMSTDFGAAGGADAECQQDDGDDVEGRESRRRESADVAMKDKKYAVDGSEVCYLDGKQEIGDKERGDAQDAVVPDSASWNESDTLSPDYDCVSRTTSGGGEAESDEEESFGRPESSGPCQTLLSLENSSSNSLGRGESSDRTRADTGVTSPEAGSPGIHDRVSGACERGPGASGQLVLRWDCAFAAGRNTSSHEAGVVVERNYEVLSRSKCPGSQSDELGAAAGTACGEAGTSKLFTDPLRRCASGGVDGDAGAVPSPSSPSTSAPNSGNSESRFNVIVQSFSAGLRESRRTKRRPLLGSLDDDSDCENGQGEEDDDGDVTDEDSGHDAMGGGSIIQSFAGAFVGETAAAKGDEQAEKQSNMTEGNETVGSNSTVAQSVKQGGCSDGADSAVTRCGQEGYKSTLLGPNHAKTLPFVVSPFPGASAPSSSSGADTDRMTGRERTVGSLLTRVVTRVNHQVTAAASSGVESGGQSSSMVRPRSFSSHASTNANVNNATGLRHSISGSGSGGWKVVSVLANRSSSSASGVDITAGDSKTTAALMTPTANYCKKVGQWDREEVILLQRKSEDVSDEDSHDDHKTACSYPVSPSSSSSLSGTPPRPLKASAQTATGLQGISCDCDIPLASAGGPGQPAEDPIRPGELPEGDAGGATAAMGIAAAAAVAAAERGNRASLEAAAAARRWEAKLKGSFMSMAGGVRWGMGKQTLTTSSTSGGDKNGEV